MTEPSRAAVVFAHVASAMMSTAAAAGAIVLGSLLLTVAGRMVPLGLGALAGVFALSSLLVRLGYTRILGPIISVVLVAASPLLVSDPSSVGIQITAGAGFFLVIGAFFILKTIVILRN